MADNEKFSGFLQNLIDENEQQHGVEVRKKFGDKSMEEANDKVRGLTREQYEEVERIRLAFEEMLTAAFQTGNPSCEMAQKACDLHRQWLCVFYPHYSKVYHKGLGEMYVADERFRAHYDRLADGCAEFLRDAIHVYCGD